MVTNDILNAITLWTDWANKPENKRYDIALFKIWIQFEKFMADLFINYATGNSSEVGFKPSLKLCFSDESHLNVFLREGNRTYVEYPTQIKKLSKHIFTKDPFDVIFSDNNISNAYNQIIAIRNYIAHVSGESKAKLIKTCFGGRDEKFKEPNDFLQSKEKSTNHTYYTYYIDIIKNVAQLLINPPE